MKIRLFKNRNEQGFSLIEVMIGMSILTIAIVAATSILISLINSNKAITRSLQAFYLAQEGIEGIRNIRDTNALNNLNYLGHETDSTNNIWPELKIGQSYIIFLTKNNTAAVNPNNPQELGASYAPWNLKQVPDISDPESKICFKNAGYFSDCGSPDDVSTDFSRVIKISDYCSQEKKDAPENLCKDFSTNDPNYQPKAVIVTSTVKFGDKSISLDTVLTDWKSNRQ